MCKESLHFSCCAKFSMTACVCRHLCASKQDQSCQSGKVIDFLQPANRNIFTVETVETLAHKILCVAYSTYLVADSK